MCVFVYVLSRRPRSERSISLVVFRQCFRNRLVGEATRRRAAVASELLVFGDPELLAVVEAAKGGRKGLSQPAKRAKEVLTLALGRRRFP